MQQPIYKRLHLQLTGWYVLLSGMTSIALVVVGTWLCYKSITDSINKNIEELIASNLSQIALKGDQPYFLFAGGKVSNDWAHQQSTVQLYDAQGKLLEEFGAPGINKLELYKDYFEGRVGDHEVRGTCDPIKIRGRIVAVRLDQLINHAVGELKQDFIDKQIALEIDTLDPITVEGDEHALHRVFSNLLGNALRYSDGGTVSVRMNRSKNLVRVVVRDTGIGIDSQSLPHIFERFYRVDESRSRAVGGSGLGLSIVKALCEYHKGFVLVESEEGKGSTFTVILPCMPAPMPL